jgi:hypothetical protein
MKLVDGDKVIDIDNVQVIDSRPDDVIVVTVTGAPTEALLRVREAFGRIFLNNKVVVTDSLLDIKVVKKESE